MNIYKNLKIVFILSLLLFSSLVFYRHIGEFKFKLNILNLTLSYAFFIIAIINITFFLKKNIRENLFPLFPLIITYFLITYGLGFEFVNSYFVNIKQIVFTKAYIVMNIGLIFLGLGYFITKNFFRRKKEINILTCENFNFILLFGLTLIFLNILNKIFPFIPGNLDQIIQPTISIGCCIIFYYFISFNNYKKYFLLLPIIIIIFLEILKSSYVYPATIILQYFIIIFIVKKKIPIIHLAIFLLIFIFLHSFKTEFRKYVTISQNYKIFDKSRFFIEVYGSKLLEKKNTSVFLVKDKRDNKRENYFRLAHSFFSLLIIVDKTPSQIEYLYGNSYKILLSKFIPRIFWKNKPTDDYANYAGRRYQVLNQQDLNTSWNFPILNEAYANFGYFGVAIVMFFFRNFDKNFIKFIFNK